jgi:NAD(P)-dependent dehydrogenase (short-subunit alcohol dehydrogenase family)
MPQDPATLFDLSGRVACVTGASSGLGRRSAELLARAGARVVGVARRKDKLEEWRSETQGQTAAVTFDISDKNRVGDLARAVSDPFGAPDIVVHAAGINARQEADDVTVEGWDRTLDINLAVPFFLSQALVPAMKEKRWGRIVTFASLQTTRAFPGGLSYGASKAGIAQLTRAMAQSWSRFGINANAIGPGFFETEMTAPVFADPGRSRRNASGAMANRRIWMAPSCSCVRMRRPM